MNERKSVVVIAEDDPDVAFLVCHELRKIAGLDLCHFPEGRSALERLLQEPFPAALVTDLHMPVMNGFDLIQAARAEPRLQGLRIVVFSASIDPAEEARCERLGADGFVRKSQPLTELQARIGEMLAPLGSGAPKAMACRSFF